tara:strand:- start:241 stop:981 length:741 start_codon:yes stop_codon:yes gene_type:complete
MAYNNLSGTVFLPAKLTTRLNLASGSIISGNLDYSDGSNITNVPRLSNALSNGIVMDTGGDANTLHCHSGLTFDGTTLNLTGHLTASIGLSASFLYGDGRYLTNVTGSGGNAAGQGPSGSLQFHTSTGTISGSSDLIFRNDVLRVNGGIKYARRTVNGNSTISTLDFFIGADSTNGVLQITLPAASATLSGQTFVIKDEGGAAASNNITVTAAGSDTIDGINSVVLKSPYASIQLYCNGSNKYFIY